ncbi:MAG TPA: IS110 family transposase [Gemmataceae bacterium]|nr:IS110 family transposase [Gemmataceae bacterium]
MQVDSGEINHKIIANSLIRHRFLETGQLSTHLYHGLKAAGFPVICIDARHAHGTLKAQQVKTDKNDARGLAQIARTGWYKAVHVKSGECQSLRTLVAGRKHLVSIRLEIENHIRGTLKAFGIKLGAVTSAGFSAKVKATIACEDNLVKSTMLALLKARDGLVTQEKMLDKQCTAVARQDAVCKRLMTVPGVGVITALAFKAEIDDPTRFRRSRDVGVHVGLTPRKYASGEIDRSGGISKCGNGALRSLLFEASMSMLTRSKKWSRLKAWGVKLAQRNGFKAACTAVARKLAIVMHRMWINETIFAYGDMPAAQAA